MKYIPKIGTVLLQTVQSYLPFKNFKPIIILEKKDRVLKIILIHLKL